MKKKANKKGFTIMEMLIVVAIIAVLVAIAIPTFNNALTKSKEAADVANIRAAYAEIMVANLTDGTALPADKTAFLGKVDGGKLNYNGNLEYNATKTGTTGAETISNATITYTASKLTNSKEGTDSHVFTWKLVPADAGN